MNNHCVPDFAIDDEFTIPTTSSGLTRAKKSALAEAEVMELLWQNGQVVVQNQNQRSVKKSQIAADAREVRSNVEETIPQQHLFMHDDEMASWLHYPLEESTFERDLYADLLYSGPSATVTTAAPSRTTTVAIRPISPKPTATAALMAIPPRPPIPPPYPRRTDTEGSHQFQNFAGHFQRLPKLGSEPGRPPPSSCKSARETAVVDSNETPMAEQESRVSNTADSIAAVSGWNVGGGGCSTMNGTTMADTSMSNREPSGTCDRTITSSPGGSAGSVSVSASGDPPLPPPRTAEPTATGEDRKRKGRENDVNDDAEDHSEDAEFEFGHTRKQARGTTSAKRSRAAEVHNLSERRRRDRINEKMRALQELIPRCNKADKASMLDEAIEYLKSLQLQVQMMSMGCNMVPMMYPGMQQYMPMGMGMEMGLSRPMMPYPPMLPGSAMQNAAHMGPRFPMQPFYMPGVHVADPSRIQASNQPDPMLNSLAAHNSNHPRLPNFTDPYQQFLGLHQTQVALQQNQAVEHPSNNKPRRSKEVGNPGNHQSD